MSISINTNSATTAAQQNSNDVVGLTILKKALAIEAQTAQSLIAALPTPPNASSNLPPNLGKNINTTA